MREASKGGITAAGLWEAEEEDGARKVGRGGKGRVEAEVAVVVPPILG